FFGLLTGVGVGNTIGCKALTPEAKQNILQTKDVSCALSNAFLPDDKIKTLCQLADDVLAPILDLVSAQRVALAKEHKAGLAEGSAHTGFPSSAGGQVAGTVPCTTPAISSDAGTPVLKDAGVPK